MRMVRAILICPYDKVIYEVEHNADNYRDIYRLLSHPDHPVGTFTAIGINEYESILVDDNGLLENPTHFFLWKDYAQPLAGRGLILGNDEVGETVSTKLAVEDVTEHVQFRDDLRLEGFDTGDETIDHPIFGKIRRIWNTPVFSIKSTEDS